jgi:glutaredoxin-related protein
VHNWNTFAKTISESNATNESSSVFDGRSKRLNIFLLIDGSIPRTSCGGSAKIPHILSNTSADAISSENDGTWKEILLGLPENGRWETALRLHDNKRDGSFDHTTTRNMPLSTIPFVQP